MQPGHTNFFIFDDANEPMTTAKKSPTRINGTPFDHNQWVAPKRPRKDKSNHKILGNDYRFLHPLSGWWFGTCFIFPYIGNSHANWLIFFRGVETTNQLCMWQKTFPLLCGNHCPMGSGVPRLALQGLLRSRLLLEVSLRRNQCLGVNEQPRGSGAKDRWRIVE